VNYSLNPPLLYGVQRYYIATSLKYVANTSGAQLNGTGGCCTVKYLDGAFTGSLTPSPNANASYSVYSSSFTPISFYFKAYNKIRIQFGFPSNNNSPSSNTLGNNYITSYSCSVRIINSDSGNTSFVCPNNNQTQPIASLSMCGRAYLSTS
jgi:hypothetical protein